MNSHYECIHLFRIFEQLPHKIPRKNKIQCAADSPGVPICAKPFDPKDFKVAHRNNNNNNNVVKNNVGEKGCADNLEKGGPDVGPSVAAAASTATNHKKYGPNVEDTLVSYC
jgi:hypothetical protein